MRHVYLVTYDIADPTRLRRVHKAMKGFGDPLQLSVFRCELSEAVAVRMRATLSELINADKDQVLIFRLGPLDGAYSVQVEALGLRYDAASHDALVV